MKGPEKETRYLLRSGKVKVTYVYQPSGPSGRSAVSWDAFHYATPELFRSEVKWEGPLGFGPTGIFGAISGGGPLKLASIDRTDRIETWRSILRKCYLISLQYISLI